MKISIRSIATLSALGSQDDAQAAYARPDSDLTRQTIGAESAWAGALPQTLHAAVTAALADRYGPLDPTVQFAVWTAREAVARAGWTDAGGFGVNIGSSRGATQLWEAHHRDLLSEGRVRPTASPSTTLGNIASWVAADLGTEGPALSHSITCSTALHAILNGCAWLQSGFCDRFLAGGSEAPLTAFTLAQMQALKIYSEAPGPYPCRALDPGMRRSTMVLGEGAGVVCLEAGHSDRALGVITGIGYATEPLEHGASLSADASCLQASMRMALAGEAPESVDAVVLHAPGTLRGDRAELEAVRRVFGPHQPYCCSNKWKIGHTLGASGILNLELGLFLLAGGTYKAPDYLPHQVVPAPCSRILVNAVGFGGNAVSLRVDRAMI